MVANCAFRNENAGSMKVAGFLEKALDCQVFMQVSEFLATNSYYCKVKVKLSRNRPRRPIGL
jgi:hypothetical protein